jgi:hypothetical protein
MGWALLPNRPGRRIMTDALVAGSILIQEGTHLPDSVTLGSESYSSGWAAVQNVRSELDRDIKKSGWTFFFMAGEIKSTVFGFDRQKSLGTVLKRLIASVKVTKCNSFEITQVTSKTFLRVPYVSITAHRRHLQKGLVFSGQ